MNTNIKPINKCEKCGCEILDGDRLCVHCYKKRFTSVLLIFLALWLGTAIITTLIFEKGFTFGGWWFWLILFPFLVKKSKYITPRRIYYNIPVTLKELAPRLIHNVAVVEKYKKSSFGKEDKEKINAKNFALFIERDIYKDLPRATSNILSDFPDYISFNRR